MKENISILLVEDDDVDSENVARAFKKNKIANPLHITENGEDALAYLRHEGKYSDPKKSPRPGLILLDLNMPIMNGIEFLEVVKSDDDLKKIPVVVMTSSEEENDRIESYSLSVAGYIIKPVGFDNLVKAIKNIDIYWSMCELSD